MNKKIFTQTSTLLLIILVLAFLLRVVGLDRNPPELFGDELDVGYQAYSLLKTGRDYKGHLLPTYLQSFSEWRAPFLMYVTAPFIAIFGLNEWGVRLPSALFGTLTILLLYYLVYYLSKDKKLSLLAALFLTISPWHIQYSRAAFEVGLMLFLIVAGCLAFLLFCQKNSSFMAVIAGILFALSLYTYNTANIFIPLLMFILVFIYPRPVKKQKLIAIMAITFAILIIPLVNNIVFGHAADRFSAFSVFDSQEIISKINLIRAYPNTNPLIEQIFHNKPIEWTKKIIQNYSTAFSSRFLFIHGDVTFRHSLHEVGQLFWFQLPLILIGVFLFIKNRKKHNLFWLSWLLIAPIPASLTIDGGYHATRLFLMVIPFCVLSAYGGLIIMEKLLSFKKKSILFQLLQVPIKSGRSSAEGGIGKQANETFRRSRNFPSVSVLREVSLFGFLALLIFLIPLMEFLHYQHYYWQHYPLDSWRWWHYGYKEAIQSLIPLEDEFNQVIIETTYEPALIRYIFWKKYEPRKIHQINDQLKENAVDGLTGFCLDEKTCFIDFKGSFEKEKVKPDTLYLISQERNIPGDWDWSKSAPEGIEVIKTIRNPWNEPILYLVKSSQSKKQ